MDAQPHHADASLKGKLRRHGVRLMHRRPGRGRPARPMISFTFDDAPISALTTGAGVLERHGGRGTYFICAGTAGQESPVGPLGERAHVQAAQAAGHEIGCHTYSHLDCGHVDASDLAADLGRNGKAFAAWGVAEPTTFAYPFGEVGPRAKRLLGERFAAARGVHRGLVTAGGDLAQVPAIGVEGDDGEAQALHWMDRALKRKAWLILYTHGVEDEITRYGCTTAAFERLVARAVSAGFEIVTVAEGARRMRTAR